MRRLGRPWPAAAIAWLGGAAVFAVLVTVGLAGLLGSREGVVTKAGVGAAIPGVTAPVHRVREPADRPRRARSKPGRAQSATAQPARAVVVIGPGAHLLPVPRSYLGLSTEYRELPSFERRLQIFERVLAMLHVPGDGPLLLRIGGDSADHSFWDPTGGPLPSWAVRLSGAWLAPMRRLVKREAVRLILDLNLVTGSPLMAARWVAAARRDLPRHAIAGLEVGNEPDIYSRLYWQAIVSRRVPGEPALPATLSAAGYVRDFRAYAQALERVAPDVPVLGPAVANPVRDRGWVSKLIYGARSELAVVSAHRYPYSACARANWRAYPTIPRLLSERASAGMAKTLAPVIGLAHRAGLPFRLTELNSVTCGGRPGVSDAFATALWAPDALFELLHSGVDGVNVHVRADAVNGAFAFGRTGLEVRPLLYGLVMFNRTLGRNPELVGRTLYGGHGVDLKVWASRAAGRILHVLLIDKSNRAVQVVLRLPGIGVAKVQRLLAPAVDSRSGVTLAGQTLSPTGRWLGRRITQALQPQTGGYQVALPRFSAAVLSVRLAPGALG